jgi:putative ABC transport system permease protein
METLLRETRLAARRLRRSPAFAAVAILTLALGIGLTTSAITIAEALLFRELPVREQNRVVVVAGITPDGRTTNYPLTEAAVGEFTRSTRTMTEVAHFTYEGATPRPMKNGDAFSTIRRSLVSGNFFATLGTGAALGRTLRADDDALGAEPVMVLSHRGWTERFNADPGVIGRRIDLYDEGRSYVVVGVMPRGLDFPQSVDAWTPVRASVSAQALPLLAFNMVGRLTPSARAELAAAELTQFWQRDNTPAQQRELSGGATLFAEMIVGSTRPAVIAFSVAAMLLLLITCVNVANLLLVRGMHRAREFSVRLALGASIRQLVTQLSAEYALLAMTGAAVAMGIAIASITLFRQFAPATFPRADEISVNGMTAVVCALLSLVSMLLFAWAPSMMIARMRTHDALRGGARQTGSRFTRRITETLVVAQVAIAIVVLSASVLVGRSFANLQKADLAFDAEQLLIGDLSLRADMYATAPTQLRMLNELLPAIAAIPGVTGVTPVVAAPFSAIGWDGMLSADGQTAEQAAANPMLNMELAHADYFRTMGIAPSAGRVFTVQDREGSQPVVVLSESAARHYWQNSDAVGKQLYLGSGERRRAFTVIGVVPDTRYRDLRTARASIYFPLEQSFFPFAPTSLAVRSTLHIENLAPVLRRAIDEHARGVALVRLSGVDAFLREPLAQPKLNAFLLAVFAGASASLAGVGLFGVMATMVRQRTREFGVRQALGATAANVATLVLRTGFTLAVVGCVTGLLLASMINQLVGSMLYGVEATDVVSSTMTVVILLVVAAVATAVPARMGARVSPQEAMRSE